MNQLRTSLALARQGRALVSLSYFLSPETLLLFTHTAPSPTHQTQQKKEKSQVCPVATKTVSGECPVSELAGGESAVSALYVV